MHVLTRDGWKKVPPTSKEERALLAILPNDHCSVPCGAGECYRHAECVRQANYEHRERATIAWQTAERFPRLYRLARWWVKRVPDGV